MFGKMISNGFFLFFLLFSFVLTPPTFAIEAVSTPMESSCPLCHQKEGQISLPKNQPECQSCHGENPSLQTAENQKREIPLSGGQRPIHVSNSDTLLADQEGDFKSKTSSQELMLSQEMVYVPEGTFLMGNNGRSSAEGAGNSDEEPLHPVSLKGYRIDRYETTNAMYEVFCKGNGAPHS